MLVSLWRTHRGGLQGPGPLPFAGGLAEQPAITMEAFRVCDQAATALRAHFKGEGGT